MLEPDHQEARRAAHAQVERRHPPGERGARRARPRDASPYLAGEARIPVAATPIASALPPSPRRSSSRGRRTTCRSPSRRAASRRLLRRRRLRHHLRRGYRCPDPRESGRRSPPPNTRSASRPPLSRSSPSSPKISSPPSPPAMVSSSAPPPRDRRSRPLAKCRPRRRRQARLGPRLHRPRRCRDHPSRRSLPSAPVNSSMPPPPEI